jgi:hypothetical protein
VKTDPRDATTLCQRLSRCLEGNTRELAVIRVPSEEEEQARTKISDPARINAMAPNRGA